MHLIWVRSRVSLSLALAILLDVPFRLLLYQAADTNL